MPERTLLKKLGSSELLESQSKFLEQVLAVHFSELIKLIPTSSDIRPTPYKK